MDVVDREELISLLAEALMRDSAFRPQPPPLGRRGESMPTRDADVRGRSCRSSPPLRHSLVAPTAHATA
jgi:hypothetical protein